jgi:hypothetical protein
MNMRTKFLTFFSLVTFAAVLSILDSWIIQQQLHGEINVLRAAFQIALAAWILYLLWFRSASGYVLALAYVVADAIIYGYELVQFYVLGNPSAALPTGAVISSALLILSAILAIIVFGLDYLDYRNRSPKKSLSTYQV